MIFTYHCAVTILIKAMPNSVCIDRTALQKILLFPSLSELEERERECIFFLSKYIFTFIIKINSCFDCTNDDCPSVMYEMT